MNAKSIPEQEANEGSIEDNEKYGSRYLRRTPWNDDSPSDDSDVVSVSSLDTVENENLPSNVDEKTMQIVNNELLGDIAMHLSDPEEGELAEENEASDTTKNSTEKGKDNDQFAVKLEKFSFKNTVSKAAPMSFVSEGKYQKKGISPLLRPKYDNYRELCAAELHCTLEENKERLNQRAKRFGLDVPPEVQVSQEELDSLYNSLGIPPDQLNSGKIKNLRMDTIHVRGVEEMDGSDVVQYFDGYQPWSLEWINDHSCNVLFKDDHYSAKALLSLSTEINLEENAIKNKDGAENHVETDDSVNLDNSSCTAKDKENHTDDTMQMEVDKHPLNETIKEASMFKMLVPPGKWRIGRPCLKAETVLMRFATKDDRKLPGAEKRSLYYQKYGNPNYGGLKGLISSSRKRKFQSGWSKQDTNKMLPETCSGSREEGRSSKEDPSGSREDDKTINNSDDDNSSTVRQKRVRMRMYADDMEGPWQKITSAEKKKHEVSSEYLEKSVFAFSQPSTTKHDVYSRFKIWTPIAKKMAKESKLAEEQSNYFGKSGHGSRLPQQDSASQGSSGIEKSDDEFDLREKLKKMRSQNTKLSHRSPLVVNIDKNFDSDNSD